MRHLVASVALIAFAAVGVTGCNASPQPSQTTAPRGPTPASAQTVLPFTGLESPQDLAVDTAGNVYVSDLHHVKDDNGSSDVTIPVIKLAAGSNTQTALPQFVHASLMADAAGAVWVVDAGNEQLVKLVAGSTTQPRCRFPTLAYTARFMQWIPLATRTAPTAVVSIPMGRAALLSTW